MEEELEKRRKSFLPVDSSEVQAWDDARSVDLSAAIILSCVGSSTWWLPAS